MEQLSDFWEMVVDFWNHRVFEVTVGQLTVGLIIILIFTLLRKPVTDFIINRLKKLTHKDDDSQSSMLDAIHDPLTILPIILGIFLAGEYIGVRGHLLEVQNKVLRSLMVVVLFWSLINILTPSAKIFYRLKNIFNDTMVDWMVKLTKAGLMFLGAASILELWGVNVGAILAGLGILGVAVALGAQEMFKNLIAGFLIIAEKRFVTGDRVSVEGLIDGIVENVGFRSTVIRRFDKAPVYIPNAKLSEEAVINFSKIPYRRILWKINLEYKTSATQLENIRDSIKNYISESGKFTTAEEAALAVKLDEFAASSIDLLIVCFARTVDWTEWMDTKEELLLTIKRIVEEENKAGFAFPSQSIYVEQVPEIKQQVKSEEEVKQDKQAENEKKSTNNKSSAKSSKSKPKKSDDKSGKDVKEKAKGDEVEGDTDK